MNWKALAMGATIAVTACSSSAERAAEAAMQAQQLSAAGDYRGAAARFNYAVALRDDLPDLWIARARNQVLLADYGGAFASYRNALDQDRSNREALNAVSQLSLAINDLDNADKYADQILALDPNDISAKLVHATAAFRRGRDDDATATVGQILTISPANEPALVLKSRLLQRRGDAAGAEAVLRPIFDRGQGELDLRRQLTSLYERNADARALLRVAKRSARAQPRDAATQLAYAKLSFLLGQYRQAAATLNVIHRIAGSDSLRDATVAMLDDAAIAPADVLTALKSLPSIEPSLRWAAADYAILHDAGSAAAGLLPDGATPSSSSDARALYGLALATMGHFPEALRVATGILGVDDDQPEALMARALAELAANDTDGALRDARIVLRDNPSLPGAAALLARVYGARREPLLASKTLADGFNANQNDAGFLRIYVADLVAKGRTADASDIARSFVIRNAGSVSGWAIRRQLCRIGGDQACVARTGAILARLHGADVPLPAPPPEESQAQHDIEDKAT